MPMNNNLYPRNWPQFAADIRTNRAHGQCECTGQCGLHAGQRCIHAHRRPGVYQRGTVILSTAHLCQCRPRCAIAAHVKAMCQRCHLRLDRYAHAARRLENQRRPRRPPGPPPASSSTDLPWNT